MQRFGDVLVELGFQATEVSPVAEVGVVCVQMCVCVCVCVCV